MFSNARTEHLSSQVLAGTHTPQPEALLGFEPEFFNSSIGSWIKPEKDCAASASLQLSLFKIRSEIKWDLAQSLQVLPVKSDIGNDYKYSMLTPLPFFAHPPLPVSAPGHSPRRLHLSSGGRQNKKR